MDAGVATIVDRHLLGEAGRAHQLNLGATVARGDVLWFCTPTLRYDGFSRRHRRALATPDVSALLPHPSPEKAHIYRLTDSCALRWNRAADSLATTVFSAARLFSMWRFS